VLVVLEDTETQKSVLQMARHHKLQHFHRVFAHEDRTTAEQQQFLDGRKRARASNTQLEQAGLLDQPFRYVVRGDRVRCINVSESRELQKSVYVTEQAVKQRIDEVNERNHHRLRNSLLTTGTVSDRSNRSAPSRNGEEEASLPTD
jgi:hypothetical protein